MKKFGYTNLLQVPRVNKVVLNIGAGEGSQDTKKIQAALNDLDGDRRPEGRHHPGQEGDFDLQDHRRASRRREGHACAATRCTNSSTA